jgi:hypothetical protein
MNALQPVASAQARTSAEVVTSPLATTGIDTAARARPIAAQSTGGS